MAIVTFQTKKCPFCAEVIQAEAIKCRFCGEFLNSDRFKASDNGGEPNSQLAEDAHQSDNILFEGRPSLWAMAGSVIKGLICLGVAYILINEPVESIVNNMFNLELTDNQMLMVGKYRVIAGAGLALLVLLILLVKMVRLKMTRYEVSSDRIEWSRGILDRRVDNLDMFRVIDLKLRRSLLDCIVGIGTVGLITTDKTDPKFTFEKMRNCRLLYDIIKKASLDADRRNSVVHLE